MQVLAVLGKILLFLAGWPMVLDLIGPRKLTNWKKDAEQRRDEVRADQASVRKARPVEALTRIMARHAVVRMAPLVITRMTRHGTAENGLPPELLMYLRTDQFTAWIREAHAKLVAEGIDPRKHVPDYYISLLTDSARKFMLQNDRLPRDLREGLGLIDHDIEIRRRRHWKIGLTVFSLGVPATVALLWLSNEHNSVLFFGTVVGAGGLALYLWGGLLSLRVLLGFQAAGSTTRILLARTACAVVGKEDCENKGEKVGHPMRWAALIAFVVGALLDLITTVR